MLNQLMANQELENSRFTPAGSARRVPFGHGKSGFTLLELVCALVLTVSVSSLVLILVSKLYHNHEMLTQELPDEQWVARIRKQLELDFAQCRKFRSSGGRTVFEGYCPIEPGSTEHAPSEVLYLVIPAEGRLSLVRTARNLQQSDDPVVSRVLASGLDHFAITNRERASENPGIIDVEITYENQVYSLPLVKHNRN